MEMESLNIWHILIFLGAAQGAFLAFIFFNSERYQKTSNKFLALLLLSCAVLNFTTPAFDICFQCKYPWFLYLPLNWTVFIPFSLYYFVEYLINPSHKWNSKDWMAMSPIAAYVLFAIVKIFYMLDDATSMEEDWQFVGMGNYIFQAISVIYLIIVLVLIFKKLHFFNARLYDEYSNIGSKGFDWLRNALVCITTLGIVWGISVLNEGLQIIPLNSFMYPLLIGMSMVIYWVGYTMYLRKDLFEVPVIEVREDDATNVKSSMSSKTDEHYHRLLQLMTQEHLYRDPDLSMTMLARKTELSNGYLSQIINQKEGKNFFEFVNGYRIEEVKILLQNPEYDHYSVLGIGQEAGFNSKSTFNAVFKKMTGHTPSAYRKMKKTS